MDRLSNFTPGLPPAQPQPGRNVRQAQAAFFQAALGKVQGAHPPEPQAPAPVPVQQPQATQGAAEPKPTYRPGSLLDIKI